jgi:glucuronate isomerase
LPSAAAGDTLAAVRGFIHDDFLLGNRTARRLYHEHAARLRIVDYHSHLSPSDLAEDRVFENLAQVWIHGDPYKHRAMRIAGVPEAFITGNAPDRERFDHWAATVPRTVGNPLFHWTALELLRYFEIDELLTPDSAERVWTACNGRLRTPAYGARGLVAKARVECVCTSDRLLDTLEPHARLAASGFETRVLPSLRADDAAGVSDPGFPEWVAALGAASGVRVDGFETLRQAVGVRLDQFDRAGCRLADHALDDFAYAPAGDSEADATLRRRLAGGHVADCDLVRLRSALLRALGVEYGRRNWILQLHLGAQRRTSSRLRSIAGPAGGYAGIGRACDIPSLCAFLDDLEGAGALPRTILYTLNPADNAALAVLTGSYAADGVPGKVQFGPAWWHNDHADGIRAHLATLSSFGLLRTFVGMTTDSRSLLSMTRHEYFRRVLCDFIGARAEAGEWPRDELLLAEIVREIAYDNPRRWVLGGVEAVT